MTKKHNDFFRKLTFRSAILDSHSANIAIIDSAGEILAVNNDWHDFADANEMTSSVHGIGVNYLDVCRTATGQNARTALAGLLDVINKRRTHFTHEYPCHSPTEKRWFVLGAAPLIDHTSYVAVTHRQIS